MAPPPRDIYDHDDDWCEHCRAWHLSKASCERWAEVVAAWMRPLTNDERKRMDLPPRT